MFAKLGRIQTSPTTFRVSRNVAQYCSSSRPIAVVTGANTGIGFETSKSLAMKGYDVVMACRDT